MLFKIPPNADVNFVHEIATQFKAITPPVRPFNQRVEGMFWEEDEEFDGGVTTGAASIVRVTLTDLVAVFESVAATVNVYVPAAAGVPDSCPDVGSSDTPDGRVPLDTV